MRNKVRDHVYRTGFADYATTSGIIDSATQGEIRYQYGHGQEYFKRLADPNYLVYHELIADYSSMKIRGDNHSIRFLRMVLGDQIMDYVDNTYQQMLK